MYKYIRNIFTAPKYIRFDSHLIFTARYPLKHFQAFELFIKVKTFDFVRIEIEFLRRAYNKVVQLQLLGSFEFPFQLKCYVIPTVCTVQYCCVFIFCDIHVDEHYRWCQVYCTVFVRSCMEDVAEVISNVTDAHRSGVSEHYVIVISLRAVNIQRMREKNDFIYGYE